MASICIDYDLFINSLFSYFNPLFLQKASVHTKYTKKYR